MRTNLFRSVPTHEFLHNATKPRERREERIEQKIENEPLLERVSAAYQLLDASKTTLLHGDPNEHALAGLSICNARAHRFIEAEDLLKGASTKTSGLAYIDIAAEIYQGGENPESYLQKIDERIRREKNLDTRGFLLRDLVALLSSMGQFDRAKKYLEQFDAPTEGSRAAQTFRGMKEDALQEIGEAYIHRGDLMNAKKTANQIRHAYYQSPLYKQIVHELLFRDQLDEAAQIAKNMSRNPLGAVSRYEALKEVVEAGKQKGLTFADLDALLSEALSAANSDLTDDGDSRGYYDGKMRKALIDIGRRDLATRFAANTFDITEMAIKLAKQGEVDVAEGLANRIQSGSWLHRHAMHEIQKARRGEPQPEPVESKEPYWKIRDTVEAIGFAGRYDAIVNRNPDRYLKRLREIAEGPHITPPGSDREDIHVKAYEEMVSIECQRGDFQAAKRIAEKIPEEKNIFAWISTEEALRATELFKEAAEMIESLSPKQQVQFFELVEKRDPKNAANLIDLLSPEARQTVVRKLLTEIQG